MTSSRQLARLSRKKSCSFCEKKKLLAKWQSHFKVAVCRNHQMFINIYNFMGFFHWRSDFKVVVCIYFSMCSPMRNSLTSWGIYKPSCVDEFNGKSNLKLRNLHIITCPSIWKVVSKMRYLYIIMCSSVGNWLKVAYLYVIICPSLAEII